MAGFNHQKLTFLSLLYQLFTLPVLQEGKQSLSWVHWFLLINFQFKIFHPFCGFESKTELKAKIAVLYLTGRVFHFLKTTREPDWRQSVRTNNRRIQEIGQLTVQIYGRNVNRHGGTSNQRNISKSRVHPDLDGAWWVEWILFDWVKTLIELMIMGGRIWKTDDSVSTRDFSFLSDISLVALTARCSIYPATEMQKMTILALFLPIIN